MSKTAGALPCYFTPARPAMTATGSDSSSEDGFTPSSSEKGHRFHGGNVDTPFFPFPECKAEFESDQISTPLSPPLSPLPQTSSNPRKKGVDSFTTRLKSRSGLKLHVNGSVLRQYTDYDNHGTPGTPAFSPGIWTRNTFGEPDIKTSLDCYEDSYTTPIPILDPFALKTVEGVLRDPAAVSCMRQFAQSRGRSKDTDFLLKVEEYVTAIKTVSAIISSVSLQFTGIAATAPVGLPATVSRSLNTDIKNISTSLLPGLEGVFDEARSHVERSIAHDIYPDFLKHQLSLRLQTIGPGYSPNQLCPGFGEAFCITDSCEADHPMLYVSDGLACLTGYSPEEIVTKDCRFFQGPGTRVSGVDRIRDALARHEEYSELVLNYKKDGKPFWNLLFTARLVGLDGTGRYCLGGQIDVSEVLERLGDVTQLMSYVTPLSECPPMTPSILEEGERRSSCRGGLRERGQERERERKEVKYPPQASRNRFLRNFRRRHSQGDPETASSRMENKSNMTASEPTTPMEERISMAFSGSHSATHHAVLSPYSRFMVLEYVQPNEQGQLHDKKGCRAQLPVAFCSSATMESLGASHGLDDVLGRSVFEVFSDIANSSSVNKSFKSTVRASLAEGRTAKLYLTLNGNNRARPTCRGISLSRKPSGVGLYTLGLGGEAHPFSSVGPPVSKSTSFEKLASLGHGAGSPLAQDFVSHWTPLKDGGGTIRWVVVILVPEVP